MSIYLCLQHINHFLDLIKTHDKHRKDVKIFWHYDDDYYIISCKRRISVRLILKLLRKYLNEDCEHEPFRWTVELSNWMDLYNKDRFSLPSDEIFFSICLIRNPMYN